MARRWRLSRPSTLMPLGKGLMPAVAEDSPRAAQLLACCLLVTEVVGFEGRALASGLSSIGPLPLPILRTQAALIFKG